MFEVEFPGHDIKAGAAAGFDTWEQGIELGDGLVAGRFAAGGAVKHGIAQQLEISQVVARDFLIERRP